MSNLCFYLFVCLTLFSLSCDTSSLDPNLFSKKKNIMYYNNQPFTGTYKQILTNGSIKINRYKNGIYHGYQTLTTSDNQLLKKRRYKNGKCFKKQLEWWPNGVKKLEFYCNKEGQKDGAYYIWYDTNTLERSLHYKNGVKDGEQVSYYNNGYVRAHYIIKKGRRFGLLGSNSCLPNKYRKPFSKNKDTSQ